MNYYSRHINDYAGDTGHLTILEHGVYTLLLDRYYATESPIPDETKYRLARARSEEERAAVDVILGEFFVLGADGWRNKRADEQIAWYHAEREKKKAAGQASAEKRKNSRSTGVEHVLNAADGPELQVIESGSTEVAESNTEPAHWQQIGNGCSTGVEHPLNRRFAGDQRVLNGRSTGPQQDVNRTPTEGQLTKSQKPITKTTPDGVVARERDDGERPEPDFEPDGIETRLFDLCWRLPARNLSGDSLRPPWSGVRTFVADARGSARAAGLTGEHVDLAIRDLIGKIEAEFEPVMQTGKPKRGKDHPMWLKHFREWLSREQGLWREMAPRLKEQGEMDWDAVAAAIEVAR